MSSKFPILSEILTFLCGEWGWKCAQYGFHLIFSQFLDPFISGNVKSWGLIFSVLLDSCIDISNKSLYQFLIGLLNLQWLAKTQNYLIYKAITTNFEDKKHIAKIIAPVQYFFYSKSPWWTIKFLNIMSSKRMVVSQ